jgi:predicted AAA+ superfamily ATPase
LGGRSAGAVGEDAKYGKKDKLELQGLRNTHKVMNLLRLLAFQTGSEVSLSVLGRQLGMDNKAPWSVI